VSHDPRGYSPAEAAKLSSMSRRTIFRYIHNGRLKAKKIGPRLVRIPKDEMEKLLSINPAVFNNAPAESADGEARS
jgi:excisionase family DNA binding protein